MDVSLLHQLMRPGDEFQSVYMAEVIGHFGSEHPPGSSGIYCPVFDIFWVGPHQVAEGSFVWDFYFPIDGAHLIDGLDFGAESSMDAEDLA